MDMFFLQLAIVFTPGIIWERIDNRFGVNRPSSQFDIIRRAFCFGLTSYLFVAALVSTLDFLFLTRIHLEMASFQKDTYTLGSNIFIQITFTSFCALGLSIAWLYITNNKIPVRFMQYIKATRRFGDEDVWDFVFNSRGPGADYVHVRDFDNELNWSGWVDLFSETEKTRELVLRDVEVTNFDGELQYVTPRVYLARAFDSITIEFPYRISATQGASNDGPQNSDGRIQPGGRPRSDAAPS